MATGKLRRWIREAVTDLSRGGGPTSDSLPIDFLLDNYRDDRSIEDGLNLLRQASAHLEGPPSVVCLLAVPLPESESLEPRFPDLETLPLARDTWQPPKLYVLRANLDYLSGDHEEYRAGIPADALPQDEAYNGFAVSYTCFRDGESRRRGWSFQRTVWFGIRG